MNGDEWQRGQVLGLESSDIIDWLNCLQGFSDMTIRSALCDLAGILCPGDLSRIILLVSEAVAPVIISRW